ncbi:MAG: DUF2281 domain-containing protein [Methylovulum sp.]|nr:MAG: DUF2281 domain-containing protein [Methylovulum sp.]
MNIADTIYQHVKAMPTAKAIEVLHFIEFLETKADNAVSNTAGNDLFDFMQSLPVGHRTDEEINQYFQSLRDEWDNL